MTGRALVVQGDALRLPLPDASVDAIVCDPPYGLSREPDVAEVLRHWLAGDDYRHRGGGFMGATWDSFVPGPSIWREAFRVAKPGAYLLAFGSTRTTDLLSIAIRLAGFEYRDTLCWLHGQGFPKNLDVGKAIDKAAGVEREVVGEKITGRALLPTSRSGEFADGKHGGQQVVDLTAPATPEAARWQGWGTALKPAFEPIVVARKPLAGTVAQNVLTWGTGALNIDAARVGFQGAEDERRVLEWPRPNVPAEFSGFKSVSGSGKHGRESHSPSGRWPPNVVLSHTPDCQPTGTRKVHSGGGRTPNAQPAPITQHGGFSEAQNRPYFNYADPDGTETVQAWRCHPDCPVRLLDTQSGESSSPPIGSVTRSRARKSGSMENPLRNPVPMENGHGDQGGASRFFPTFPHHGHDSFTMEACQPPGDSSTTDASTSAGKRTASSADSSPTDGSGSRPTAPSQPATTSTIGTSTPSTTTSPTSPVSPEPTTSTSTGEPVRTTPSSMGSSTDDASGATPIGPLTSSPSEQPAPIRATARTASGTTTEIGEQPTGTTTTPTCGPTGDAGRNSPRPETCPNCGELNTESDGKVSSCPTCGALWNAPQKDFGPRFMYCAKPDQAERVTVNGISHPTQKPLDLMRWLVRLVTPPAGIVLDPFAGSGTTGEAAMLEHRRSILVEREAAYLPHIRVRTHPFVRRSRVVTNGQAVGPEQRSLL